MLRVAWKKPQPSPQQGKRKPVMVSAAIVKGQGDRFLLYQTAHLPVPEAVEDTFLGRVMQFYHDAGIQYPIPYPVGGGV